jgi:hypothetical protein
MPLNYEHSMGIYGESPERTFIIYKPTGKKENRFTHPRHQFISSIHLNTTISNISFYKCKLSRATALLTSPLQNSTKARARRRR